MQYRRPRLIYFGPMSLAVLYGQKTSVRVPWASRRSIAFQPGETVPACDQRPKRNGKQIATLRITQRPYRMNSADLTEEDYAMEGFLFLEQAGGTFGARNPRDYWEAAREAAADLAVLRFEVVEVLTRDEADVDTSDDPEGLAMLGLQYGLRLEEHALAPGS